MTEPAPVAEPVPAPAAEVPLETGGILEEALASIRPPDETPQPEPAEDPDAEDLEAPAAKEEDDFSDARPWTPERVQKAAATAKEMLTKAYRVTMEAEQRQTRLKRSVAEFKREKDVFFAARDAFHADMRALETGDPATVLQALGRITKRDGTRVYTDLSLSLAGKKDKPNEVEELRAEIRALKEAEAAKVTHAHTSTKIEQAKSLIVSGVRDAQRWPTLSKLDSEQAATTAAQIEQYIVNQYQGAGRAVDIDRVLAHDIFAALNEAELYLRDHPELLQPGADKNSEATTSGVGGQETAAKAKPETARSTPGKSLTPSIAAQGGGSSRQLSKQDRLRELANDADFLRQIGLGE